MGELIHISTRRVERQPASDALGRGTGAVTFHLALDCPLSYLTAERVERAFGEAVWVPVLGPLSEAAGPASCADRGRRAADAMRHAERESRVLGMPLVRPRRFPLDSRRAARAATLAAQRGVCQRFSLAITRLAFCGGFDISAESAIKEAAAVAGLDPQEAAAAASDPGFDHDLDQASLALRVRGGESPPAITVGEHLFEGVDAILEATAFRASRVRLDPGSQPLRAAPLD